MKRLMLFVVVGLIALLPLAGSVGQEKQKDIGKAKYDDRTYVPTADEVIYKMFDMAKITKDDVIFDLGCGDGRILYMAAKKYGCRCVGLDTNPDRITEAMDQARKYDVGTLVEIRHGDALKPKDISDATVVVMYMFPKFMNLWQPIAKKELKPGTRILSHDYAWDIGNWEPDESVTVKSNVRDHKVFMWTVKERKK
jgi:SAM-dependent methyltransferase